MLKKLLLAATCVAAASTAVADPVPPTVPTVPSAPAGPALDCQTLPGSMLCAQLDDLLVDYTTDCTGEPCSILWRTQAQDDLSFLQSLEQTVVPSTSVAADLAVKAQQLATDICTTQRTSVDAAGYAAVDAENKLLPHLADLQARAGYETPVTCTISVQ